VSFLRAEGRGDEKGERRSRGELRRKTETVASRGEGEP